MELITDISFWLPLIVTILSIAESTYLVYKFIRKRPGKVIRGIKVRIPFYGVAIISLVIILVLGLYQHQKLYAGKDVFKSPSISIKIPFIFTGPFYNSEGYDLQIELTNNLSKVLLLSEVRAYFYNSKVPKMLPQISLKGVYYTSVLEKPGWLLPNESKTFTLPGPVFIPTKVDILVFHFGSRKEIKCNFIVSVKKYIEALSPYYLDFSQLELGIDGLDAIIKAREFVRQQYNNIRLLSCMPGSHTTYMHASGLSYHNVVEWIIVFKYASNRVIVLSVKKDEIKLLGTTDDASAYSDFPGSIKVEQIRIGTRKALMLAAGGNCIYGDGLHGWALLPSRDDKGEIIPVWRLPYIGSDYLDIILDADKGEILSSKNYYELCKLPVGSVTKKVSEEKEPEK